MSKNSLNAVPTHCLNELDGECDDTTVGNVIAAGNVMNAIQLRSSTGTFTANNDFYFDAASQCVPPSYTIYKLIDLTLLNNQSAYITVPESAKRITVNFTRLSTSLNSAPVLQFGPFNGPLDQTGLRGVTWGLADTTNQTQWTAGVQLFNAPATYSSAYILSGSCVITKVGTIGLQSYYTVHVQTNLDNLDRVSFGAGHYTLNGYISIVAFAKVGGGIFDAGEWSLNIE